MAIRNVVVNERHGTARKLDAHKDKRKVGIKEMSNRKGNRNSLFENIICKQGCGAESLIFKLLEGRENTKIMIFKNPLEFTKKCEEDLVDY